MNWKKYIGDSVYVDFEHGMIKLTTENGYGPTNTIFLEFPVYEELVKHVEFAKTIHWAHTEIEKEDKKDAD